MHHTLRFYRRHQGRFLRFYMLGGRLTRLPLVGRLVRGLASRYGYNMHTSYSVSLSQAHNVVDQSSQVLLGPCRCRQVFHRCQAPLLSELVIGIGAQVFPQDRPGEYQPITREQAHALLDECHRRGMFHTLMQCQEQFYALCNCCHCCCVPTRLRSEFGIRGTLVKMDAATLQQKLATVKG